MIIRKRPPVHEIIIEIITDACLIALPFDLLYLYFAGGWYEPNIIILIVELVVLPFIILFGMFRVWRYIRKNRG